MDVDSLQGRIPLRSQEEPVVVRLTPEQRTQRGREDAYRLTNPFLKAMGAEGACPKCDDSMSGDLCKSCGYMRKAGLTLGSRGSEVEAPADPMLKSHDPLLLRAAALQVGCAELVAKALKGGEGSRGGKIIGHTKSGKPIYGPGHAAYDEANHGGYLGAQGHHNAQVSAKHFPDYSAADHHDAYEAHDLAGHTKGTALHFHAGKAAAEKASSEPPGSYDTQQAKSTGNTEAGKMIPHVTHPAYAELAQHPSAEKIQHHFPGWSEQDHRDARDAHNAQSDRFSSSDVDRWRQHVRAGGVHQIAINQHSGKMRKSMDVDPLVAGAMALQAGLAQGAVAAVKRLHK